jgi:hypothetical protein
LSSNPLAVILAVLFLAGAVFYFAGGMIARRADRRDAIELRVDMVERLLIVGQPWCVEDLKRMRAEDEDALVRDAADAALIAITARRPGSF